MKEMEVKRVVLANDDEVGDDRISNLPEPLVHHIMSFLPPTDLAITSALSKKFNSLWSSFPIITFDENLFRKNPGMLELLQSSEARNKFLDFVVRSIQIRQLKTRLEKFSLKCYLADIKSDPRIDMVINFALDNNVKDLYLDFSGYRFNDEEVRYHLKETFYLNSVCFLTLSGFKLNLDWLVSTIPLMQSLSLRHCFVLEDSIGNDMTVTVGQSLRLLSFMNVNVSEKWVEKYIGEFKKLEILHIRECRTLTNIQISNEKLKEVELNDNLNVASIEMIAPGLVSFQHFGQASKPCAINIASCKLVKYLSLKAVHVNEEWLRAQVSLFSRLEKLRLKKCVALVRIQIASTHLQELEVRDCAKLVEVNIDTPNLMSFKYSGVLVYLSLMNSPRLRNPTLRIISSDTGPANGFSELRDFLTMFDHCEALTLVCRFYQDFVFPKDLRDTALPPLYDIKSLRLDFWSVPKIETELVDSLLWISPHAEILCFASNSLEKIIKLRYERKKTINTNIFCCNFLPIKCWRHYLEGVEMDNFDDSDDIKGLVDYFKTECEKVGNSLPRNP